MASFNFSGNGTQTVSINIDDEFSVGVAGDFGSGTLTVSYYAQGTARVFQSGETGTFTAAGERVFRNCGDNTSILVTLAGSTSPDLDVSVANNAYGA